VHDLTVLAGVKLEDDMPLELRIVARPTTEPAAEPTVVTLALELIAAATERTHYRAVVALSPHLPEPPVYHALPTAIIPFGQSVADSYEQWLFHGPIFQTIQSIDGWTPADLVLRAAPCPPSRALANGSGVWLIDPVLFDAALQGALLWERQQRAVTPIPLGFDRICRYAPAPTDIITCHLRFHDDVETQQLRVDIAFLDTHNQLVLLAEGVHGQYTAAFNRLGGSETYQPQGVV
jgi:hypothetical protein